MHRCLPVRFVLNSVYFEKYFLKSLWKNGRRFVFIRSSVKADSFIHTIQSPSVGKEFRVDEEFVKYWRAVAVDGIDDGKVEEYLKKHGITSMADAPGKRLQGKDLKRKRGKQKAKIVNNEHLKDVLEDYSDKAALGGKKFEG